MEALRHVWSRFIPKLWCLKSGCGRLCWTGLTELGSRRFVGWILLFWWGSETKDISFNTGIPNCIHWNCLGSILSEQRSDLCWFDLQGRKFRRFLSPLSRQRDRLMSKSAAAIQDRNHDQEIYDGWDLSPQLSSILTWLWPVLFED